MGWRTTAVLAAALLVASLVAWIDLASDPTREPGSWAGLSQPPAPGDDIKRLVPFEPADVVGLRLQRDQVDVKLERVGGVWQNVARPQAIDDFVRNVSELAEIMPLEVNAAERQDYGLDPPVGVIELERSGQPPIVLLLGKHNPSSTGAYAQVGRNGPAALTGAVALWELDKAIRIIRENVPTASIAGDAPVPTTASAKPSSGDVDSVAIIEHRGAWESGYGSTFFNIVGRVRNTGTTPIRWIKLRAELLDDAGAVVGKIDFFNYRAEALADETLPEEMRAKLEKVKPEPIATGGEDRFRGSVLKEEAPSFATYRLSVAEVGR